MQLVYEARKDEDLPNLLNEQSTWPLHILEEEEVR